MIRLDHRVSSSGDACSRRRAGLIERCALHGGDSRDQRIEVLVWRSLGPRVRTLSDRSAHESIGPASFPLVYDLPASQGLLGTLGFD